MNRWQFAWWAIRYGPKCAVELWTMNQPAWEVDWGKPHNWEPRVVDKGREWKLVRPYKETEQEVGEDG